MKWISLLETAAGIPSSAPDTAELSAQYRAGRGVGVVTLGERYLFFRRLWSVYYLPYEALSRFFRRIVAVPAKIGCCGTGEIRVEHLVLCAVPGGADGQPGQERELAQIQLPGERAALALMEELRRRAPHAAYGRPVPGAETAPEGQAAPGPDAVEEEVEA